MKWYNLLREIMEKMADFHLQNVPWKKRTLDNSFRLFGILKILWRLGGKCGR